MKPVARTLLFAFASLWIACMTSGAEPSREVAAASAADLDPPYFHSGLLTLRDRIWAQRQIERVFDRHRIWPKDNPQPKPSFEQRVPTRVIEGKVLDSLRMSAALKQFWSHTVSPAMLQAELDRMARDSRDPAMLRELFAALHDDPFLISEALARPQLAGRIIREAFAADPVFQAEPRAKAAAIASSWRVGAGFPRPSPENSQEGSGNPAPTMNGIEYHRHTIILDESAIHHRFPGAPPDEFRMSAEEFAVLAKKYATDADKHYPIETAEGFLFEGVVNSSPGRLGIESLFIPKADFSRWWVDARNAIPLATAHRMARSRDPGLRLPEIVLVAGCDEWSSLASVGAPSAREFHTAAWTGAELIVWGGEIGFGTNQHNTGGRYFPATDSWLPTSLTNAPGRRSHHSAVWTGNEMIIWGGYWNTGSGFVLYTAGGRYDTASDSWTATSAGMNVPEGRENFTATWTGSEMIVWGGDGMSGYLNSGGRYCPYTNTWLSTSTGANVPQVRNSHSAVWNGSVMIVWGGLDGNWDRLNSGGIYAPSTDSWEPTTFDGAPESRNLHAAAWAEQRMIIWGGIGDTTAFNSGGKYDPGSDSWIATSISNDTPTPRGGIFSSVWTGIEMIIWGGVSNSAFTASGGRYSPASDQWKATAISATTPTPRSNHTALWTGDGMFVWGGYGTGGYKNNGAVYRSGSVTSPGNGLRLAVASLVKLSWLPVAGAGSYNVKRCEPAVGGCVPATVVSTPTLNQYSEPDDGLSHFYAVEAVNQCGATP